MSAAPAQAPMPEDVSGTLSQWALTRRRFARHKLARASLYLLAVLYVIAIGAEFFAPYPRQWRDLARSFSTAAIDPVVVVAWVACATDDPVGGLTHP